MADQLSLNQWASGQDQPDVTVNTSLVQLSSVISDYNTYDFTSGNVTLTLSDFQDYGLFITTNNTSSGSHNTFTLPKQKRAWFLIYNDGSAALNVVLGSTTITLTNGFYGAFRQDGTTNGLTQIALADAISLASLTDVSITSPQNNQVLTYNSGASKWENENNPYDFGVCFSGAPGGSQTVNINMVRALQLPASLTGSEFNIAVNPTATMTFTLKKISGGTPTSIGTIAFSTGGAPTVTFASPVSFAIGDILSIIAPASPDATGATISFTFLSTLL